MVGDGPDRAAAEQRITEWGLQGDVVFLGKVKNPVEALMISDLFLLPSESESFGLAALEAMAAGVPVIGSNAGGMPEVIRHGVSGLLSDVGSTRDLARNAIYLLESKERMAQFSQQAKERALEFRIDRVMPKYEALYNKALRRD
jgi:glycosyltransferase involved in cell wall biosynthesis